MNRKYNNIAIVMSALPLHSNVGIILLEKFSNIVLEKENGNVYIISGNVPKEFFYGNKLNIIGNIHYDTIKDRPMIKLLKYILMQIKFSATLFKNRDRIDKVYFWISSAMLIPMITAKLLKKRTLIMATGYVSTNYKSLKILETINYHLSDIIGVESISVVKHQKLEKYAKKVVILHLYVDNKFVVSKDIEDRSCIIGYIGRLSKEKGILEFLDAAELLIKYNENFKIIIGGGGPLRAVLEERLKKIGGNITFLGWIPSDNFVEILNDLRLLVLPSYTEGLPNIVLEAMACGTPVLATPVGGIPDVIKDRETGFILKKNSPVCIAKSVIKIMECRDIDNIVKKARKLIESRYSYGASIDQYEKIRLKK